MVGARSGGLGWGVGVPIMGGMARVATGALLEGVSGQIGGGVVVTGRSGLVLRRRSVFRKGSTPAQRTANARFAAAMAAFNALTPDQADAWDRYARTLVRTNPLTGEPYQPTGVNAFVALATKVLQVDPGAAVPVLPPGGDYVGDPVTFEVSVVPGPGLQLAFDFEALEAGGAEGPGGGPHLPAPPPSAKERVSFGDPPAQERGAVPRSPDPGAVLPHPALADRAPGEPQDTRHPQPPTPSPQNQDGGSLGLEPEVGGGVRITASGPNRPGSVTEILLERLTSPRAKPRGRFVTAAFATFLPGSLSLTLPLAPGAYAFATRFVERATGRTTLLQATPRVVVPDASAA